MAALIFDSLAFSKKLKLAGFNDLQAETQAEAWAELIEEKIATKQDINNLRRDIDDLKVATKHDIDELRIATKHDIGALKKDMLLLKKDLLISIGGMMAGAVILLPAIFKLISLI